ncbi:MAG: SCO family protein [Steroidobacteraceae bacterium]
MLATAPKLTQSRQSYAVPDALLLDEQGRPVALRTLLSPDRPVILNFIYTSCTTICPVMTGTMLQVQRQLADTPHAPTYVSLSIDPDFDVPMVLKSYAQRYGADWRFLTGTPTEITAVLRNFDAWRGSKANHAALTLMRAAHDAQWTRLEGLASAEELVGAWTEIAH